MFFKETIKQHRESKEMILADSKLGALLADDSSRESLLQVANFNGKQEAALNNLYAQFDKEQDKEKRKAIMDKIENTFKNGPKTKAEVMVDEAFEAFLSGEAGEKAKVAEKYLGDDIVDPKKMLQDATEVLTVLKRHQKLDDTLAMKAASVVVYGQLYGMGGVISKKECDEHNKMLKETAQARAIWNIMVNATKGSKSN